MNQPPPGITPTPPAVATAVAQANAKQAADAIVATNPNATHAVKMAVLSPEVAAGASTGALIGTFIVPGLGTLAGAALGGVIERYQVFGGPVSKVVAKARTTWAKWRKPAVTTAATTAANTAAATAVAAGAPPVTTPPAV